VGTIRERQKGIWEVRVSTGRDQVTGRYRQVSRTVKGGKRAAEKALSELTVEAAAGKLGGSSTTVGAMLDRYLEHLEAKGLAAQTLHGYRRYVRVTIVPALGPKQLRHLTAFDLDQLYAGMKAAGRKPATIRQTHAVLSGALGQALKWGWVGTNVAKMASPPPVRQAEIAVPSVDEVRRLISAAEETDPILAALLLTGVVTGARRGELCALRWSDCDLDAGTVRIARSMIDLPGRVDEKSTKNHQARVVSLGAAGTAVLQKHRAEVEERARIGETAVRPDAYVFSRRLDGGAPIRPDSVTGAFTRLRDKVGLPSLHFHSLRHFAATQLAARGDVAIRTIAGRLGHADASVTMKVYSHMLAAADEAAANHLGELFAPASTDRQTTIISAERARR